MLTSWEMWKQDADDDVNIFLVIIFRLWSVYVAHYRILLKSQIRKFRDSCQVFDLVK